MQKTTLGFWQIWNMSFGFLGIQFGFALQNANVSRIFETLGAKVDDIPILWLAAPTTGLIVQPIIGYMSDRTWCGLGRRRPYFLIGAILASLALLVMPNSPVLWIAAGMLWVLDASINISMEPFRALVADLLPSQQRTLGFAIQSFFIGTGAVVASLLPYFFQKIGIANTAPAGQIPPSVQYSFYIGAIAFLGAVTWTVATTREHPPENLGDFERHKAEQQGFVTGAREIISSLWQMPKTMMQLAVVQFFSWFALFAMWIYTTAAVTRHMFGTQDTTSLAYNQGANWVGVLFAVYNGVAALAAFVLPYLAFQTSRKTVHILSLLAGSCGLAAFYFIRDPQLLLAAEVGVGIAWASILSMPYAILAGALPAHKMGLYMGIFNFFIVIPQIVAAGILGYFMRNFFHNDAIYAMLLGSGSLVMAAIFTLLVHDVDAGK